MDGLGSNFVPTHRHRGPITGRLLLAAALAIVFAGSAFAQSSQSGNSDGDASSPVSIPQVPAPPKASFPYTIQPGDSLGALAARFGVTVDDLARLNHINQDTALFAGETLKIPNPFLARERQLTIDLNRLGVEKSLAEQEKQHAESQLAEVRSQLHDLEVSNNGYLQDASMMPWWRRAAFTSAAAAVLMLGVMLVALFEWWMLRARFRAVAEMNESLRRLDYKYRTLLAKAELRLQELYGRRRHGIEEGQERPRVPEEIEIERLSGQLKEILERHLERLGPPGERAQRARSRELVGGVGSPVEARTLRR